MSLSEAEKIDNYILSIQDSFINKEARQYCKYKQDTNNFLLTNIKKYIKQYQIFNDVDIILLDPSAENGYPHTRPNNIICIPSNASFPDLEITLFHEVVHIHQRNNKILWNDFLLRNSWMPFDGVPQRWREKCRLNPDTLYSQYYILKIHMFHSLYLLKILIFNFMM